MIVERLYIRQAMDLDAQAIKIVLANNAYYGDDVDNVTGAIFLGMSSKSGAFMYRVKYTEANEAGELVDSVRQVEVRYEECQNTPGVPVLLATLFYHL